MGERGGKKSEGRNHSDSQHTAGHTEQEGEKQGGRRGRGRGRGGKQLDKPNGIDNDEVEGVRDGDVKESEERECDIRNRARIGQGRGSRGGGGRGGRGGGRGGKMKVNPSDGDIQAATDSNSTKETKEICDSSEKAGLRHREHTTYSAKEEADNNVGASTQDEGNEKRNGKRKVKERALSMQGVIVMLAGTFCMSGSIMTMKLASKNAPIVQVRCLRSLACLALSFIYAKPIKGMPLGLAKIKNKKSLALRMGMTVFQMFAQLYVARKLPLGLMAALMGMSPVTQSLLNRLVIGTRISWAQWGCIVTTVGGVLLISQPALIFGAQQYEVYDTERCTVIILAVAMNVMRALTMVLNRKLIIGGETHLHFSQFAFYNNLLSTCISLSLMFLRSQGNVAHKIVEMPQCETSILIFLGALMFFGRPFLMEFGAGTLLPMSMITVLRTSSVVWAFMFQLLLFGDLPNMMESTGITLIICTATIMYKITGQE